jgi:hypothetical protein
MSPHDQQRFAKLISARGTTSVTRYGPHGVKQISSGPAKANWLRMIPPLVVSVISADGCGKAAKISVEAARA